MKIVSVGEILWDVVENAEHLGGAPFNFSAHAAQLGHEVFFVSAVGRDERGDKALARVADLGLTVDYISRVEQKTGIVTVTLDAAGQPDYVIHRPAAYDFADLDAPALARLAASGPEWVCFGTLHQMNPHIRVLVKKVIEAVPAARRFYDVNLRKDSFEPALVRELLAAANVVKLNDDEVVEIGKMLGLPSQSPEQFCRANAKAFGWDAVCVTRGAAGCSVLIGDEFVEASGYKVKVADTIGSGDAFSAAFLHGLGKRWPPRQTADFANRVGAFIASRAGAIPKWTQADVESLRQS